MKSLFGEFSKGLWDELPPFRIVLGLCPTLAVTKTAYNGLGMGLAVIFVLTLSNLIISLVRSVVPAKVRIAGYIVIIASLVVAVELLMQAFVYPLYLQLGIFVPLIVVNCLILGRAEAFAQKNSALRSVVDGLGMGVGFTLSLTFLGVIRESLGDGTIFGASVVPEGFEPFTFMVEAPGAFVCLGLVVAAMNFISSWNARRKGQVEPRRLSSCTSCGACALANLSGEHPGRAEAKE
jgi:electron transport complex protein RnfE